MIALQAIAEWAEAEAALANLFAALIGSPATPATAAYFALTSGPGQIASMEAFAAQSLRGEELEAFYAVITLYKRLRKPRNDLAHGKYGVSDQIPDAVVIVSHLDDKRHESIRRDDSDRKVRGIDSMSDEEDAKIEDQVLRSIYVYKDDDLFAIANDAVMSRDEISRLILMLNARIYFARAELLRRLLDTPRIRTEVEARRKQGQSTP